MSRLLVLEESRSVHTGVNSLAMINITKRLNSFRQQAGSTGRYSATPLN